MTDLLFYTHRAKEKEKVHKERERKGKRDGDRKGHRMKERQRQQREREGGRQKRALTFCEGYKKSSSLRGHPTI